MRQPVSIRRRRLLLGALGLAASSRLPGAQGTPTVAERPLGDLLVSGFYTGQGLARRDWLAWSDLAGLHAGRVALPMRAHGACRHPAKPGHVVCFARRPGNQLWEVDLSGDKITTRVDAGEGYHYFGHGVFSPDGGRLYTTEQRIEDGTGLVRVRDGRDYRVIDEMPSGGIGPHEIRMLSDGRTLVVANGGIATHPAQARRKLNLGTMDPSLAYLDSTDGRILEQHRLPHHQLSIRHLAVGAADEVVAVQQFEGPRDRLLPLVLVHQPGAAPRQVEADRYHLERMRQYTASVAVDSRSGTALVTSPKGNLVTLWSLADARLMQSNDLRQPYGAAIADDGTFVITGVTGQVHGLRPGGSPELLHTAAGAWDNHALWLAASTDAPSPAAQSRQHPG